MNRARSLSRTRHNTDTFTPGSFSDLHYFFMVSGDTLSLFAASSGVNNRSALSSAFTSPSPSFLGSC